MHPENFLSKRPSINSLIKRYVSTREVTCCTVVYSTVLYGTVLYFMVLYYAVQFNIFTKNCQNHFKVTSNQLEGGGGLEPIVSSLQKVKMSKGLELPKVQKVPGIKVAGV